MKRSLRLSGAIALSLALVACGSSDPETPGESVQEIQELDELYESALESGRTTISAAGPPGGYDERVVEAFEEEFPGITVNLDFSFGATLQQKMAAYFSQGEVGTDVTFAGAADQQIFAENGWLEPYRPETMEGIDEINVEEQWASPSLVVYGPTYNSDLISGDLVPTSYQDMTNPDYSGIMGTGDLTIPASSAFAIGIPLHEGIIDEAWVEDFTALDLEVFPTQTAAMQATISGQSSIQWSVSYTNYLGAAAGGAPIEFAALEEGVFGNLLPLALVRDTPNPDAARLFIAWLYSDGAQSLLAETGVQGTMPDAPRPAGLEEAEYVYVSNSELLSLVNDPAGFMALLQRQLGG